MLTLSPDSLVVRYLGRRRVVPYGAISNVKVVRQPSSYGIIVEQVWMDCRNGRTFKFGSLKEGVRTFHQALRAAWSRSTGAAINTDTAKLS